MPKETFNNLSEDKKQKIFNAAVREFSTKRFSEASINQIVKAAGIPRGSFYQYFKDKEDIFLYVFNAILKEKQEVLRNAEDVNPDADVFEVLMQTTRASYKWSKAKPEYSQISMLMEIDNSEFITRLRTSAAKVLREMVERDKQRGLIKPEIDPDLVVEMIYTFYIKEYFWIGLDEEVFLKRIKDVLKMIKEGIANV
ncbi:TetR/AcrR family transcriptional regulator [Desulfitobacterium sp. AusDCA]|uniref:TetR/AcrR family transcriptional regulator n=1 Tax=Desulfitobacterium sp. AusDCA TaxID=3240383 RepID=UPI003DA6CEF1